MFETCLTTIYTKDIERAVGFYRDVLGFAVTHRFPKEGALEHVEFRIGTATLAFASEERLAAHGLPLDSSGSAFELALRTPDLNAALRRLRDAGVTTVIEPFTNAAGNRVAYVSDPDGTRLQLYSPKL